MVKVSVFLPYTVKCSSYKWGIPSCTLLCHNMGAKLGEQLICLYGACLTELMWPFWCVLSSSDWLCGFSDYYKLTKLM
uniref:Uncharacterized protein n=1 Tax=Aegilops tauschii subsp. strangulata TaxID=200361 RepID=A0A453AUI0_AEGTS